MKQASQAKHLPARIPRGRRGQAAGRGLREVCTHVLAGAPAAVETKAKSICQECARARAVSLGITVAAAFMDAILCNGRLGIAKQISRQIKKGVSL